MWAGSVVQGTGMSGHVFDAVVVGAYFAQLIDLQLELFGLFGFCELAHNLAADLSLRGTVFCNF
jgi:hypothetical protein